MESKGTAPDSSKVREGRERNNASSMAGWLRKREGNIHLTRVLKTGRVAQVGGLLQSRRKALQREKKGTRQKGNS